MDLHKEREAFEAWAYSNKWNIARVRDMALDHYVDDFVDGAWHGWQAAKDASHNQAALYQSEINHLAQANQQWREKAAQAIPDGFVVVPKEPTEAMVEAGKDSSECGGWPDEIYKAMIEAQEQK